MGLIRKRYSPELKAKIGLAAIKELVPLNEMPSGEGVHPSQITQWKKTILDSLPVYLPTEALPIGPRSKGTSSRALSTNRTTQG